MFILSAQNLDWAKIDEMNSVCIDIVNTNLNRARELNDSLIEAVYQPYDSLVYSKLLTSKANIFFKNAEYNEALKYNLEALQIRESIKDSFFVARSLGNIGNVFYYVDDLDKAIEYHQKSVNILSEIGEPNYTSTLGFNTIALVYLEKLDYDSSEKYFNKGIQACKNAPAKYRQTEAMLYSNKATLYQHKGDVGKSLASLRDAISIHEELGRTSSLAWTHYKMGEIYLGANEVQKALNEFKVAGKYGQSSSTLELQKDIAYKMFRSHLILGQVDSALWYNNQFYSLNDSIVNLKTQENIQNAEAKYQTEKTQAELVLEKEQKSRLKAENKIKELWLWAAIIAFVILAIVFFISYRSYQQKRKLTQLELTIKESQLDEMMSDQESKAYSAMLKGQEEERERIAQDLHDRLGGTLAALKLTLRRPENQILDEDLEIVDKAVNEVRSIAHNLSSGILQKYGFNEALTQLKRTVERTGEVRFSIYLHPSVSALGQSVTLELYRIIQELVSNSLRHAKASEISIQTNLDENSFNLIYEDDGVGFNPKEVKNGIGLENIKTRVKKLKGNLHIDAEKGRGVIFIIELTKRS